MASFWEDFGPGLIGLGGNLYGQSREAIKTKKLLEQARGPLYNQQQQLAGKSLTQAGNMDPQAMAAERFAAQQALVASSNQAEQEALFRALQAKGMLGVASHGAVPGTAQTPGVAVNPYMAAMLAAQEGAKQRSAYDSLREGEQYLDNLVKRSGMLQTQAQGAQTSGVQAVQTQLLKSKPTVTDTLIKGGVKLLQDPKARKQMFEFAKEVPGMLGTAANWVTNWFQPSQPDYFGGADFSYGF